MENVEIKETEAKKAPAKKVKAPKKASAKALFMLDRNLKAKRDIYSQAEIDKA